MKGGLFIAATLAGAFALPSNDTLLSGFDSDGWNVRADNGWMEYNGFRGVALESKTATLLADGSAKKALYTEGDAYSMGMLEGLLLEPDVTEAVTGYEKLVIPFFVDPTLANEMIDKCSTVKSKLSVECKAWNGLLQVFQDYLEWATNKSFAASVEAGQIPQHLLDEIDGIVDGCAAANPDTPVNYENVVTIGTGMDVLMANLLMGTLPHELSSYAREEAHVDADVQKFIDSLTIKDFAWPAFCNAFAVSAEGSAEGEGAIYGRDFQLPVADTLQYIAHLHLRNPTDEGILSTAAITFPGAIGSLTAMNEHGVAMGINTIRSGFADNTNVGLGGMMQVRNTIDVSVDTDHAVETVAATQRGCPWLFSVADQGGSSAILETGPTMAEQPDLLSFPIKGLLDYLPTQEFLDEHAKSEYNNGVYVRRNDYVFDEAFLDFNEGLFALVNATDLYEAATWGETGQIFPTWQEEKNDTYLLVNDWFVAQRETMDELILVTNDAITPEMQLTMMNVPSDMLERSSESVTWRYDTWNRMLQAGVNAKNITFESARDDIMMFLSPINTPGYWDNYLDPADPMSAEIEGALSVADLEGLRFTSLWGYYADEWCEVTLAKYLD